MFINILQLIVDELKVLRQLTTECKDITIIHNFRYET